MPPSLAQITTANATAGDGIAGHVLLALGCQVLNSVSLHAASTSEQGMGMSQLFDLGLLKSTPLLQEPFH